MTPWNCQLSKNTEITVGEKLILMCDGTTENVVQESLQLKDAQLSEEIPSLTLLEIQKFEPSHTEFVVTSYRTGDHKSAEVVFYDGKNKIELTGFDWKLKSVLKQDPANPPQPYGSFPMIEMHYPIWFWILLLVILLNAIALPYIQFQRIKQRKKAFEDLKNLDSAANPLDTFFKNVRRMERALDVDHVSPRGFVDQVDHDLRIFLSRSLQVPAHVWTVGQTMREIKKKYPKLYRDHGDEIKKYFSEFTKMKTEVQKKDCLYFMVMAQKLTETIEEVMTPRRSSR